MSMPLDIWITGSGVVSPLGHESEKVYDRLLAGESAVTTVDRFDASPFPCSVAAVVSDFKASQWVSARKNLKLMSPAVRYAIAATKRAWGRSGLGQEPGLEPQRLGMFVGSGLATGKTEELIPGLEGASPHGVFQPALYGEAAMAFTNPLWLLKGLSNNALGFGAAEMNAWAINQNYCNTGVGGLQALGEACWAITEGRADVILAGGADSAVDPSHFTGFGRLGALTRGTGSNAAKPFDIAHDGFAPGEGSAFFVLEDALHAQKRGQRPMARIVGQADGLALDAIANGNCDAIKENIGLVLERAHWRNSDVDLFVAHGNGTPLFDRIEAQALVAHFGNACPPITSNKGQLGHAIAAAGPLSVMTAIEAMTRGIIAAVPHFSTLDPECAGIDLVHGSPRRGELKRCLVHSAGLGGQTSLLALEAAS